MTVEVETTGIEQGEVTNDAQAAIKTDTPIDAKAEGGEGALPEKAAPAYTPNFKYKVYDEEKEFDEWAKQAIKDAETEKQVRDLYTRATGIEPLKQDREKLRSQIEELETSKTQFDESLKQLSYYVQTDDLQSFFDALKIPKEQVLRYALREVQFSENPQLRQQYEQQRQQSLKAYQQETYGQQFISQYEQQAANLRQRELDFTMRQPDIVAAVESFDSRVGKPGAFRDEVIQRGQLHYQTKGIDMPVDQVIREVIQVYGLGQAQTPNAPVTAGTPGVVQGSKGKPVIPSIPGSGQSAVKKQIKSIAGLKEKYQELSR